MKRIMILLGSLILLPSCQSLGPQGFKKLPIEDAASEVANRGTKQLPQLSNEKSDKPRKKPDNEIYYGSGPMVGSLSDAEKRYVATREGKFTLNFENAELSEVTKVILGDTLHANYAINPKVTGKVSLQTSRPLAEEELLPTLELLLQANGAALLKSGDVYRIEPVDGAVSRGNGARLAFPGKELPVGFQVRVIPLRYISAKEMQEILKPMITPATLLRADSARNLLMLAGTETELQSVQETVGIFDVNYMQGMSFGIFPLANVDAVTVDKELAEIFGYGSGDSMEQMFKTLPIERLNAVLVITPQAKYLDQVKNWIDRLDKVNTLSSGGVNVYRVQNVKAVDLAATLSDIFMASGGTAAAKSPSVAMGRTGTQLGGLSGFGGTSSSGTGSQSGIGSTGSSSSSMSSSRPSSSSSSSSLSSSTQGASSSSSTPSSSVSSYVPSMGRGGSMGAVGAGARVGNMGDVRIIPDEGNNSLIIVAAARDYEVIRNVIKQLDVMPLQVHIEASILGVDLTDDLQYGVEWRFKNSLPGNTEGLGIIGAASDLTAKAALGAATGGFSYIITNSSGGIDAVIHALMSKNKLTVLSSPSLMVLNNQQAQIQVGDQIPIRTTQTSQIPTVPTTGQNVNNNVFNSSGIEMKDTGVKLSVTPRVNSGGMVLMDIEQDVDTPKKTSTSGIDSPTILKRAITSSVGIASGETVLLGGLISETDSEDKTGVPWLMDIPYLGDLFSTTERKKVRSELIVLITPSVVTDKVDARSVTDEYKRKLGGLYYSLPALKDNASKDNMAP